MKRTIIKKCIWSIAITWGFALTSCEKFLDVSPDFGLTENEVFSEYQSARGYLDNVYSALLDFHSWDSQNLPGTTINALSDEGGTLFNGPLNQVLNAGTWINRSGTAELGWGGGNVGATKGNVIGNAFYAIR